MNYFLQKTNYSLLFNSSFKRLFLFLFIFKASIAKYKLPLWTDLGNSNYLTQISWLFNLFIFEKNYVSGENYAIPRNIPSNHISTQSWCNYIGVIPCEIKTVKFCFYMYFIDKHG